MTGKISREIAEIRPVSVARVEGNGTNRDCVG